MSETIDKTWNSYGRHDGYVMGWEKDETGSQGHHVTLMDDKGESIPFRWRSAAEPVAGSRVSVVMVEKGVTTRRERPVLVLDHDSGVVIREQNAPPPRGTRSVMMPLAVWMLLALATSMILIPRLEGIAFAVVTLLAAALMVWRLAVATSEIRMDERAQTRIRDEEKLCLDIMTGEWRLRAGEVINLKRPETAA